MKPFIKKLIWMVLLMLLWELTTRLGLVSAFFLPSLSTIVQKLVLELTTGQLLQSISASATLVVKGYVISIVLALVIAIMSTKSTLIESLFETLSMLLNPLPSTAIMPLIILWVGIGTNAVIVVIVHSVIWPLTTNILMGFRQIPQVYLDYADNLEMSLWQRIRVVLVYAVLPEFLAGLRIGWGRSWRALIGAEAIFGMISYSGGLGYYIYKARAYAQIANVYVGILVIMIVGLLVELVFRIIERYTVSKWRA